jgi:AI-2 transport protein TqsA
MGGDDRGGYERAQLICLVILTVIATGVALYLLRPVLVPFVLALFITYCLKPPIDLQMRHLKMPRWVAIASTAILALGIVGLFAILAGMALGEMSDGIRDYQEQFHRLLQRTAETIAARWPGGLSQTLKPPALSIPEGAVGTFLTTVLKETTALLGNIALVVIFILFMLVGGRGERDLPSGIFRSVEIQVRRYLVLMVLISAVTGLLAGLTLWALGVQFPWVFGFLTFLLNFIPNIGPFIATLLPLPILLMNPGISLPVAVLAIVLPASIHFILGGIVLTRLQGQTLDLHPGVLLIALIFFGMIWGIVGTFLATPITAVVKLVCEKFPASRWMAAVLAGDFAAFTKE